MPATTVVRPARKVSAKWRKLLLLVPGYDCFETAGDCWFDEATANKAINFIENCLSHVKGHTGPFLLESWEKAIVGNLFGWKRPDGTRRYREAFIYVPRKNGKSALCAAIILTIAFLDKENGAELYSAAATSEQASMVYDQARGMVEQEPALADECTIYKATKTILKQGHWYYKAVSSDTGKNHGKNVHAAIIDELHEQPDRDLVDAFQTSTGARKQPLIIYITTADYNRVSICNEKYDYAVKVRDQELKNEKFLPVIYEADMDDDWTSPKVWAKANPNLGVSVSLEYLEGECKKAREIPAYENTFRRLHLCQRTQQDVRAIPMEQWDRCGYDAEPREWRARMLSTLTKQKCIGGLDLGSVSDLTSLVLLFGDAANGYDAIPFFWCPAATADIRSRRDGVDYTQWGRAGFINLTDGNETDYEVIRREIGRLGDQYGIEDIAADRLFQGAQICQGLAQDGFNITAFGQGYVMMASPTRTVLELIAGGKLRHGNNPVLRWMAQNAATESEGGPGDAVLKFSKRKSTEKIDGIISLTMAVGKSAASEGRRSSYYETHEVEFV